MNWEAFFADVPDFRLNRRKKHDLLDILVITLLAVICGADDFEEVELYGRQKEAFLRTFLKLPNGIASHDTFNRVFKYLDKEAFGDCLYRWSSQIIATLAQQMNQISIDGKVLRGTAKKGHKKSGLCIVSAWVGEYRLVLGEEKVAAKSNEKTAIPELLTSLALVDSLVSIDAIGCEETNADLIVQKKGHYLLALKKNQPVIYEQVSERMQQMKFQLSSDEHVDFGSGRIETRRCYVETNLALYDSLQTWSHLSSIIMVEAIRDIDGVQTQQTRFYLSDLALSPQAFNGYVRQHWRIENHRADFYGSNKGWRMIFVIFFTPLDHRIDPMDEFIS
ncbi:ISAs1 family transposase [Spirosoma foliorum]|uniref:ISAs1 family transposase n=1 Tax=Spirosoma foliorum TaxID=2710596 RepID=A0A7G5H1I2_9BACT|nr:ISAs1 family transposase [Spirosoma foliorum]QMW04974.1 ISAs1 family transposase [Spirosoma foliorum]